MKNQMNIKFLSISANEGLARIAISSFASQLNPTLEDLADIKTAISEAVTNAIVHGYENSNDFVEVQAEYNNDDVLTIKVIDTGKGIANIEKARQPFYTSKPDMDRSGMGFTVMETFMDAVVVESTIDIGTTVTMKKKILQVEHEV